MPCTRSMAGFEILKERPSFASKASRTRRQGLLARNQITVLLLSERIAAGELIPVPLAQVRDSVRGMGRWSVLPTWMPS